MNDRSIVCINKIELSCEKILKETETYQRFFFLIVVMVIGMVMDGVGH